MGSKNILLGVSGGIAAYKTPDLVRSLKKRGANVQVVLTRAANDFVTETTLQAVSELPVRQNLWDKDAEAAMSHIELARWADLVLIAPATAEIISRLARGAAADLLTTICLATEAPLVIAPAMNRVMWNHAAVQENVQTLAERGARVLGPDSGDQACGETGPGRMMEPAAISAAVMASAGDVDKLLLSGKTVMITAGPTREALDPVRFISNRSSGKMGYALAQAARDAGAAVILVSGPVSIAAPHGVDHVAVESAKEMYAATHAQIDGVDVFIAAAAVADYRPAEARRQKIKKSGSDMTIDLVRSPDILSSVAKLEHGPFTVGFAAETENLRHYALEKLARKKLHMIVANRVGKHMGFDSDDNAVDVYWHNGEQSFSRMPKSALAHRLIDLIAARYRDDVADSKKTKAPLIAIRD